MALLSVAYYNKVMEIISTAPELEQTVTGIAWQVAYAAGGTIVGGLAIGPAGAMIGGCAGAYAGYRTSYNYQSLFQLMQTLSDREKQMVVDQVQELVGSVGIDELISFVQREVGRHVLLDVVKTAVNAARSQQTLNNAASGSTDEKLD